MALAVLFGAVLHASWNTLVKSSGDKSGDTALVHVLGALLALPLVAVAGMGFSSKGWTRSWCW